MYIIKLKKPKQNLNRKTWMELIPKKKKKKLILKYSQNFVKIGEKKNFPHLNFQAKISMENFHHDSMHVIKFTSTFQYFLIFMSSTSTWVNWYFWYIVEKSI